MESRVNSSNLRNVVLLIGSNIDPINNSKFALKEISQLFPIIKVSSYWESKPIGSAGNNFINFAVMISTSLDYDTLKFRILRDIESHLGRMRTTDKYSPRTIDIDIIIDDEKITENGLWDFAHIAVPVSQLVPNFVHPDSGEKLKNIALELKNSSWIRMIQLEE